MIRRVVLVLASVALAVGMLFSGCYAGTSVDLRRAVAQTTSARPNVVFILTDDMRRDDLRYMPKTRSLLASEGANFENAFVSNALCAPSRATIMRGQYSHGNGVWSNSSTDSPTTSIGGWRAYQKNGNEADNVATRLQGAGYRTGLFGKYMNRYANTTFRPPGWDRWFAASTLGGAEYFDYDVNVDGTMRHYGTDETDYMTDVLGRKTGAFIERSAVGGRPFFAYVAPVAPHAPATPASRDLHAYDDAQGPRLSSFDEVDVSDKPSWIGELPRLTPEQVAEIDETHERRVESLQAVDDLVQGVVRSLREAGVMRKTYIFFTSDNGYHLGEHRIPDQKWRPYEEDINTPLLVRGPGVDAGSTTSALTLNTDYMPTFLDLAGARIPSYVDGRSLEPVMHGNAAGWRSAVLLEAAAYYSPPYRGIRTAGTTSARKYVRYGGGTKELYDLDADPHELTNVYDPLAPPSGLASRLRALKGCSGDTCFAAENGP